MNHTQHTRAESILREIDRKSTVIDKLTSGQEVTESQHLRAREIEQEIRELNRELYALEGKNAPEPQKINARKLEEREINNLKQKAERKSTPANIRALIVEVFQRQPPQVFEWEARRLGIGR